MSAIAYGNFTTLSTGTLSTGVLRVGSLTTASLSTTTISTGTLAAGFLRGDGSGITNLSRTSYVPYTIPLTALNPYGNLNIQYGTWIHGGMISPNALSVATLLQTSTVNAFNAFLSNLSSGVITAEIGRAHV